jgi:hypothetical protein
LENLLENAHFDTEKETAGHIKMDHRERRFDNRRWMEVTQDQSQ